MIDIWNSKNINEIVFEYLGCDKDYICNDLERTYDLIDNICRLISKYNAIKEVYNLDLKEINYMFISDYKNGRASDNINVNAKLIKNRYNDLKVLEIYDYLVVYTKKEGK